MNLRLQRWLIWSLGLPLVLQAGVFDPFGQQKVGTTVFAFLKLDAGARSAGLGGAYVGLADDGSGVFWNPAALAFLERPRAVFLQEGRLYLDLRQHFLGVVSAVGPSQRIGLYALALTLPTFEGSDLYHPGGNGQAVDYGDLLVGLTYTRKLSSRYSVGVALKYLQENLDGDVMRAGAVDLTSYYWIGFRDLRIGMGIFNLGPDAGPGRGYDRFSLPITFRTGVSGRPFGSLLWTIQIEKPVDNAEDFRLGWEYPLGEVLTLRAGYRINNHPRGDALSGWGFGVSLRLPAMRVDYAVQSYGELGTIHRVGLEVHP